jgi:GNAT superfamily N-acetyltransferase
VEREREGVIEAIVDLRLRTAPGESPDLEKARVFLTEVWGKVLTSARRVELCRDADVVTAIVVIGEPSADRFGVPESKVLVLCDPADQEARSWAAAALQRMDPHLDPHCTVQLDGKDRSLMAPLRALGFGPAKLSLSGSVSVAVERLRGAVVDPADFGVQFRAAALEEASQITALMRDFFLAHPEFGWGGPPLSEAEQAVVDARELARMSRDLACSTETGFVVVREGRLVGYFGFDAHLEHPLMGPCGGLNIVLLPEIQRLGLGKAAYLYMLERMQQIGIVTLYGMTSNPGVIRIGHSIGRRVRLIIMRRDGPFIASDLIP